MSSRWGLSRAAITTEQLRQRAQERVLALSLGYVFERASGRWYPLPRCSWREVEVTTRVQVPRGIYVSLTGAQRKSVKRGREQFGLQFDVQGRVREEGDLNTDNTRVVRQRIVVDDRSQDRHAARITALMDRDQDAGAEEGADNQEERDWE